MSHSPGLNDAREISEGRLPIVWVPHLSVGGMLSVTSPFLIIEAWHPRNIAAISNPIRQRSIPKAVKRPR
jgi:hypothetical protein